MPELTHMELREENREKISQELTLSVSGSPSSSSLQLPPRMAFLAIGDPREYAITSTYPSPFHYSLLFPSLTLLFVKLLTALIKTLI